MPGFPSPSSGGRPESKPGGSAQSKIPGKAAYGGQSGGQVLISGPEEKALRVLELDNPDDPSDDTMLLQQASVESGMPVDRVAKLKMRAEAARNKGMTLKGPTITLQPINPQVEDGLLGDDLMADVGGDPSLGAAPGQGGMAPKPGALGISPGGPLTTGATMSSAGLGQQRAAPPWRPAMSQATIAPPRMTPDLNRPTSMTPTKPGAVAAKAAYAPAARSAAPKPLSSGGAGFGRANSRDKKLAAAYAREAGFEECSDCGGTCGKKKGHLRR